MQDVEKFRFVILSGKGKERLPVTAFIGLKIFVHSSRAFHVVIFT
jgi:hypothetical protein